MKTLRQQMIAKLHILLKQQNAEDHKEVIYAAYGVASSRDMTDAQLSHLIMKMEQQGAPHAQIADEPGDVKKLRSDILSLLTKSPRSMSARQRGLGIPNDWAIINPFIVRHGHKLLFQMDAEELKTFHRKLLAMRDSGWIYRREPNEEVENIHQNTAPSVQTTQRNYMMMPSGKVLS